MFARATRSAKIWRMDRKRGSLADVFVRVSLSVGILPVFMLVFLLVFGLIEPRFLSSQNAYTVGIQSVYLIIVTIAQTLVLIAGGFDLSVGSSIALTSIVTGLVMVALEDSSAGIVIAIAAGVGVATLIGAINGTVIALFHVSPFVVTLAMLSMASGGALILSGGAPVLGLPDAFTEGLTGRFAGIPVPWIVTGMLIALVYLLLSWTRFGRHLYAVGGNAEAARLSGVRTRLHIFAVYTLTGSLTGLAGVMLTARVGTSEPTLGVPMPLESIGAAVIGGVSLTGGEGTLLGAILGAIFLVFLRNGMDMIRIGSYTQMVVIGVLLIVAIVADRYIHRL